MALKSLIVMFDGIKLTFIDIIFVNSLVNNLLFDIETISVDSEIKHYNTVFRGLKIRMYPNGQTTIKGSLHKYFNNGTHNYNDFTIEGVREAINSLTAELNLKPEIALLSNLEFGVNINTIFSPDKLLNSLIRFKSKQLNEMKVYGMGNGRECYLGEYGIKIYNKGLQYGLNNNTLRIEKRINKMCALGYHHKIYLNDLLDITLWKHCKTQLLNAIDNLTITEPIDERLLSIKEQKTYNTIPNHSKWNMYNRSKKSRDNKMFNRIIATYGKEKYRSSIIDLATSKCDQLANLQNATFLQYN